MKFIDLSGEIWDGQPGHFRVTVRDFLTHADTAPRMEPPAQGYTAKLLMLADHTGTHVDAPAHFYPARRPSTRCRWRCFAARRSWRIAPGPRATPGRWMWTPLRKA